MLFPDAKIRHFFCLFVVHAYFFRHTVAFYGFFLFLCATLTYIMKSRLYILFSFILMLCLSGCRKIVIPEEEEVKSGQTSADDDGVPTDFRGHASLVDYLKEYGTSDRPIPCEDLMQGGCVYRSVMNEGTLSLLLDCWVEGIVVGAVDGGSMKKTVFGIAGMVESNVVLAVSALERDYARCIPVQLSNSGTACKAVRQQLSLAMNPSNLGQRVRLRGQVAKYLGTLGLKATADVLFESDSPASDEPTDPPVDEPCDDPDLPDLDSFSTLDEYYSVYGSKSQPIPCEHLLEGTPISTLFAFDKELASTDAWIVGYVVGYIGSGSKMSGTVFDYEGATTSNIVIAASPDVRDYRLCMPVQLSSNGKSQRTAREQLNLKDNPQLYGRRLLLFGSVNWYMSVIGLRDTCIYEEAD